MVESGASINIPQWDGIPREAGEVWRLTKGGHTAVCPLWTHPYGGEIRATINGELWRRRSGS